MNRPDYAREVRASLTDPRRVLTALGVDLRNAVPQHGGGLTICCPRHEERTPSCSVTVGPDGTIRVRCFGCGWSGDGLHLVAAVRDLPDRGAFLEILAEGAVVGGQHALADEIRGGARAPDRPAIVAPPPPPPREYPPADEVAALWASGASVADDAYASGYLVGRMIDPELVAARSLARVVARPLPRWAAYGSRPWTDTGHTMVCRAWDAWGALRSVRACRVVDGATPKRLPPTGYRASELVLANRAAWCMLAGRGPPPSRVLVAEGEPDWLTLATVYPPDVAVLGIGSGAWSSAFAAAIPDGTDVVICTDPDGAGDRYAATILESLGERCKTWRAA